MKKNIKMSLSAFLVATALSTSAFAAPVVVSSAPAANAGGNTGVAAPLNQLLPVLPGNIVSLPGITNGAAVNTNNAAVISGSATLPAVGNVNVNGQAGNALSVTLP